MLTIHDYFQRACQRGVERLRGVPGGKCFDGEGNSARFWLETAYGRVAHAQFQCTTCCTLVALCEHARDLLAGITIDEAKACTSEFLLAMHPEIPSVRRARADLVAQAIRHAAAQVKMETDS